MRLQVTQGKRGAFPWPAHPGHTAGKLCFWEHTMRKCLTPFGNTLQGHTFRSSTRNTAFGPAPERVVDRFSCTWWGAALWTDEASDGRWPPFMPEGTCMRAPPGSQSENTEKMQRVECMKCVDQLNDELSQFVHQSSMEIAHASSINSRNYSILRRG